MKRASGLVTRWVDHETCTTTGYAADGTVVFERPATEAEWKRIAAWRPDNPAHKR
jgi:hypothetical protein